MIKRIKRSILREVIKEGIQARIQSRAKHLYSLWRKLKRPEVNWDFDKVHDIIALRIIVEKVSHAYAALGVVHRLYKPIPFGISDFIAQPKPNGYRSIHTKLFIEKGRIVEIQIRTLKMHEQAEYGIAAHWAYSEAKQAGAPDEFLEKGKFTPRGKLSWVKQLANWQKEIVDSKEFMRAIKFDVLKHRNYIFSPKGDVYDLPAGATPVDFAFAVHTDLAKYLKGAKVNGRITPINYRLRSGDMVEIIKSQKSQKLRRGWLDFVVTNLARREIKKSGT